MATTVNDRSLSGNDISVYMSPQTLKGEIDANPAFDQFRRTEGKTKKEITYVQSGEVKTNRQGRIQVQDASTFTGEPAFELNQSTAGYFDAMIHGTATDNTVASVITIGSNASGFVSSNADFAGYAVGDWFKAEGFADPLLNILYKISVFTDSNNIETVNAPASIEAEGATVTIESIKTSSGSAQTYFTTQTRTVDKSAAGDIDYRTFYDAVINTGSFEVGETGIVTGSFALAIEQLLAGAALISGQTDNAIDTSDPVSAIDNISRIYVDGVDSNCGVKSMGLEFNNNYQGDRSAACQGERYAYGDIDVSGALVTRAVISDTFNWRSKFENSTAIALAPAFTWSDGRWMVVEIMRAKLTEHSMPDGSNVVSSNEMAYSAEEDSVTGTTVQIFRNF
tara:strand:+ start:2738 stop:3922 length:1185 start_codon:yes stop_codon:yes gene_type:complete